MPTTTEPTITVHGSAFQPGEYTIPVAVAKNRTASVVQKGGSYIWDESRRIVPVGGVYGTPSLHILESPKGIDELIGAATEPIDTLDSRAKAFDEYADAVRAAADAYAALSKATREFDEAEAALGLAKDALTESGLVK